MKYEDLTPDTTLKKTKLFILLPQFPSILLYCFNSVILLTLAVKHGIYETLMPCSQLTLCPKLRWFLPFQRSDLSKYYWKDWLTVYLVRQATAQSIKKESFTRATQASLSPNTVTPVKS